MSYETDMLLKNIYILIAFFCLFTLSVQGHLQRFSVRQMKVILAFEKPLSCVLLFPKYAISKIKCKRKVQESLQISEINVIFATRYDA